MNEREAGEDCCPSCLSLERRKLVKIMIRESELCCRGLEGSPRWVMILGLSKESESRVVSLEREREIERVNFA